MTQTLAWRADLAATDTVNSGNVRNFTTVAGTGYTRKGGPTFDSGESALAPGWSLRVPINPTLGSGTVFSGIKGITALSALANCGMGCGWVKFAGFGAWGSYSRVGVVRGYALDDANPLISFCAKQTAADLPGLTLARHDFSAGITGAVAVGSVHQWIYFAVAWNYTAPNFTWRTYYKLSGGALTLLGTEGTFVGDLRPNHFITHAVYGDLAFVDPWYGAVGGMSLYALDSLNTAATYPADLAEPAEPTLPWCVNPNTGSDSDSGYSSAGAWKTADKLVAEIAKGTILGDHRGWVDENGDEAGLSTLATKADVEAWRDAYRLGNRSLLGNVIEIRGGPLLVGNKIRLEHLKGVTLRAAAGGSLTTMRDIGSTFSQPNAGLYPNVFQLLGAGYGGIDIELLATDVGCLLYAGTRLMTEVAGANKEAAFPTINTNGGRCYADSSGIYFSTFDFTDPNTDGISYRVSTVLPSPATLGPGVVALGDNCAADIEIEAGPIYKYTGTPTAVAQYVVSTPTGYLSVADGATLSQGSVHSSGLVGNGLTGAQFEFDTTHKRMPTIGGAIPTVAYTSETATTGFLVTCHDGVTEESVQNSGEEASAFVNHDSFYCHSDVGRTLPAFCTVIRDSTYCGTLTEQLHGTAGFEVDASTALRVIGSSAGSLVSRSILLHPGSTAYVGDLTLRNCLILPGTGYTISGATALQTSLTIDRCTIDLRGFGFSGGAIWTDNGTFTLTITNSQIITAAGNNAALVTGAESADTIAIANTAFLNSATPTVLLSYNDGSTTADRTYAQAVTLGLITASVASALVLVDSADNYAVQAASPVIGVAAAGSNVEDYTGAVFATRNDAGAREFVTAPAPATVGFVDYWRMSMGWWSGGAVAYPSFREVYELYGPERSAYTLPGPSRVAYRLEGPEKQSFVLQ